MNIVDAQNQQEWDAFLGEQQFRPFLQSWTMGEVYREIGQELLRLEVRDNGKLLGICQAIVVPARRGRHLSVSYGPLLVSKEALKPLCAELQKRAKEHNCSFVRISPFWLKGNTIEGAKTAPLHMLAEHLWYVPLTKSDPWQESGGDTTPRTEEELFMQLRKTTRNLVRRAKREGVVIEKSADPIADLPAFIALHEETRKRHGFTPYTNAFFRAQVAAFAPRNECTLYLAKYNGEVVASSVHMHIAGETSYHHGASTHKYPKIPASYLLQWTAITDALVRGDHIYNFWGIAPEGAKNHPFQGVTTFKTGYSGKLLELTHCIDVPVSPRYYGTRAFEYFRKWRRGF
jgi:peptidoglycan pentaglycine glycine transferase (the first glycine)